ncbi:hypothetical protein AALA24_01850 [Anaerovoracaceae bacterium 42-11]
MKTLQISKAADKNEIDQYKQVILALMNENQTLRKNLKKTEQQLLKIQKQAVLLIKERENFN